ncbi:hypothetical protein D3C80_1017360 [compost metagenome]
MTDHPAALVSVPARGPGHCDGDDAWAEFVRQYDGQPRSSPDLSDFALANRVFMAGRNDLDLIVWQTAAKERIRWLSIELAKALAATPAAPQAAGVVTLDRDALIALIMEETTDDIVSDGWRSIGKPNVLVQGCRYIRRNEPAGTDGYEDPEASAKQFAGFIADRVLAALQAEQGAK